MKGSHFTGSGFAVVAALVLGTPIGTQAQMTIDLDLDGVPGNGPDTLVVAPGDTAVIGVWFLGDEYFTDYGVDICGLDTTHVLDVEHLTGIISGTQYVDSTCLRILGLNTDEALLMPSKVANVLFDARCIGSPELIEASIQGANIYDNSFGLIAVEGTTPAYIVVDCSTATEAASWSDVKALFR